MGELNPQPLPPREVAVTVHVPGDILGNLETFQKVQASIFDRFGCGNCNSGIQIDWRRFEEFVVSPDLELQPVFTAPQLRVG
ncbi:hypothetical protein GCM10023258_37770 [Terrabacter aeriphilus]|uniref:Uncharacterized protein n=1 Tax=Terrabacter aeriphilus TaxID=515662 RepID=A0ABP9JLC8_9MICO